MLNTLLILLRFLPYIFIFCLGFYLKGCMTDKLITDLKNQVKTAKLKAADEVVEWKLSERENMIVAGLDRSAV